MANPFKNGPQLTAYQNDELAVSAFIQQLKKDVDEWLNDLFNQKNYSFLQTELYNADNVQLKKNFLERIKLTKLVDEKQIDNYLQNGMPNNYLLLNTIELNSLSTSKSFILCYLYYLAPNPFGEKKFQLFLNYAENIKNLNEGKLLQNDKQVLDALKEYFGYSDTLNISDEVNQLRQLMVDLAKKSEFVL